MTTMPLARTRPSNVIYSYQSWQLAALLLLAALAGWMLAAQYTMAPVPDLHLSDQTRFEAATGLRVTQVMLTAPRNIVDVRYQVLDPDKVLVVHDDAQPPTIINEKTGAVLSIPTHQHHLTPREVGRIYRLHIINPDRIVKRGDRVSLVVGDMRLENLVVE
ncbi:MAG: hypothetical protein R3C14_25535 [Caldilineaceae bacterium]